MFQWLLPRAQWSADKAREQFRRGNIPRRLSVPGHLDLANCAWLTYLPSDLEAGSIDVSRSVNLRGLPEKLKCETLTMRRTNVVCLASGLNVSRQIDVANCRELRHVSPLCVPALTMWDCTSLEMLSEGLRIRHLSLSGCTRLAELPASIATSVQDLDVSGCANLERLPDGFARLATLNLRGCSKITSLPDDIRIRSSIEVADSGLRSLPTSLRSVRVLWHGMPVSDRIAFDPDSITVDEILSEQNVTWRRLLLERVGVNWFLLNAHAQVLDRDRDAGGERRLLRASFQNGQDIVCVEVHCPSTGHRYLLEVPPHIRTCAQAAAWVAGYHNPERYRPVFET